VKIIQRQIAVCNIKQHNGLCKLLFTYIQYHELNMILQAT